MPKRRRQVEEDSTDDDSSPEVVGPGNEKRERRSTGSYMGNSFMREEQFMADMKDSKRFVIYVTRSRKRGHFAQDFKIELLVLKGRVALKQ